MSITKYIVINKNLDAVINYAINGEKTENGILVSTINCLPETAYSQMMLTKKAFHKEDGRLGYHIIQSFEGKEISPEKCNQIGKELAEELWGDKYQIIICTHINKENVHNHIVFNSVSFVDGIKYHNSNVEIALMKETNDDICRKYGLSIVKSTKATQVSDISKSRIANYNRNSGKMELIKADIDEAINEATKYQEFVDILNYKGYYIKKSGNCISISSPYYNRNIRLAKAFGEDYTFDNIKTRIYNSDLYEYKNANKQEKVYTIRIYDGIKIDQEKLKISSFYRLYVHYLYLLGKLPPKIHYEERTKEYYQEIDKFNKLADEMSLICTYNLNSKEDTQNLRIKYIEEVTPLKSEREKLRQLYRKSTNETDISFLEYKINNIIKDIDKINSKIQTCKRIIATAEKGEKENFLIKKRVEGNRLKSKKEIAKNKDKKRIR